MLTIKAGGDGNHIDEHALDQDLNPEEFDKLFSRCDVDGSGFLSKDEIILFIKQVCHFQ